MERDIGKIPFKCKEEEAKFRRDVSVHLIIFCKG